MNSPNETSNQEFARMLPTIVMETAKITERLRPLLKPEELEIFSADVERFDFRAASEFLFLYINKLWEEEVHPFTLDSYERTMGKRALEPLALESDVKFDSLRPIIRDFLRLIRVNGGERKLTQMAQRTANIRQAA